MAQTPSSVTPLPELRARLSAAVRAVPDHPREGILFRDITTLLADGEALREAIDAIAGQYADAGIEVVAGVESRGFIIAAPVAYQLRAGFVPIRKQGRLPAATISAAYSLEYGESVLEIHTDAITTGQRVLIVDDLLATGGTAMAAVELVERLGGLVAGLAFLIQLDGLGGAAALGDHAHTSLITF